MKPIRFKKGAASRAETRAKSMEKSLLKAQIEHNSVEACNPYGGGQLGVSR